MTEPTIEELVTQRSRQAKALLPQAARDGIHFECYLPPSLAVWLLRKIEERTYNDPQHAIFAIVNDHVQLCRLADVREAMVERSLGRSSGGYFPQQTLEEVAQSLVDMEVGRGVPAYWHCHGGTEPILSRADHNFITWIKPRFSTYSEATHWYLFRSLPGFGGATAATLVREGRAKEVDEYMEAADAGVFC